MTADEETIEVPGGRVWYRPVGGGASHLCFAEQPQEFMDLVSTFLEQRDAAG